MHDTFTLGDGTALAFRLDGDAALPVLILSNSIATDLTMWDDNVPALARHFRVLRYDTRGHGRSGAPAGDYSLDRLGRDVLELMDHLGIERAHFLGLSLGGFVGQWLGVHAPERIDRLILSNTAPWLGPAPQWDALIARLREPEPMEEFARMFVANWFPPGLRDGDGATVARFRAMILRTPPHGLAGAFAVVRDADLRRLLPLVDRPTLVIGGEFDTVALPEHSEQIAAGIAGARLAMLPTVHLPNVEQADAYVAQVLRFLGT